MYACTISLCWPGWGRSGLPDVCVFAFACPSLDLSALLRLWGCRVKGLGGLGLRVYCNGIGFWFVRLLFSLRV